MKKKIGDLTFKELKSVCKLDQYQCDICKYCKLYSICYSNVFILLNNLEYELELPEPFKTAKDIGLFNER